MVWQVLLSRKLVTAPVGSVDFKVFEADTADLSDVKLRMGMLTCKDFTGFFTFPAFRELCDMTPEKAGMPDVRLAYVEACRKPTPWDQQEWSHSAVYAAARETTLFEIRNTTEKECLPLFKLNYEKMVERVINGESLDLPVQKAIADKPPQYLSKDENLSRLAKLKASL